jgi:hypothetical protein
MFETGKQPCDNFKPEDYYSHSGFTHECPYCLKQRVFCMNCLRDHHEDGWENCKESK